MSKNVNSSAFRKFDVDQFNDDFKDEENQLEVQSSNCNGNNVADEQEVNKLLKAGNVAEAIRYLIGVFACAYKNQTVKDSIFGFMLQIISTVKTSEVEKIVDSLNEDELDAMMKYIYRAFEHPSGANCANLLVWHDKVFNKAGVGSIVRVLTDKKRV